MSFLNTLLLPKVIDYFNESLQAENKSAKTIGIYLYNLNSFLSYAGPVKLLDINADIIRAYFNSRKGLSDSTRHQSFRVLRTFFKWCGREGFMEFYPMSNMKAPELSQKVIDTYSRDDIQQMLACCPARSFLGGRNRAVISCLVDTGIRESELVNLKVNDVDYRTGAIKVFGKGKKERIIHISAKARQFLWKYLILRDYKASPQEPQLFLSEEMRPLTPDGLHTIIRKIGKSAGVKGVNVHKFRHTCAIEFLRNGGDPVTLQYMLGHTSITTTMRYLTALKSDDVINAHSKFSPGDRML